MSQNSFGENSPRHLPSKKAEREGNLESFVGSPHCNDAGRFRRTG